MTLQGGCSWGALLLVVARLRSGGYLWSELARGTRVLAANSALGDRLRSASSRLRQRSYVLAQLLVAMLQMSPRLHPLYSQSVLAAPGRTSLAWRVTRHPCCCGFMS